jgi:hypothetical protein
VESRLSTLSAATAEALARAPESRRLHAVRMACEAAVRAAGVTDPLVGEALAALRDRSAPEGLAGRLLALADEIDGRSFDADDDGDEGEAGRLFAAARAVSALVLALRSAADPGEAVYEAAMATDDAKGFAERLLPIVTEKA